MAAFDGVKYHDSNSNLFLMCRVDWQPAEGSKPPDLGRGYSSDVLVYIDWQPQGGGDEIQIDRYVHLTHWAPLPARPGGKGESYGRIVVVATLEMPGTEADRPMLIEFENFCSRAWHCDCPIGHHASPMRRSTNPDDDLTLTDGSVLPLWTCMKCFAQAHGGVQKDRRVVVFELRSKLQSIFPTDHEDATDCEADDVR